MLLVLFGLSCSYFEETPPPPPPKPIEYTEEEKKARRKKREERKLRTIADEVSCLRGKEFSPVPFLAHQNKEEFGILPLHLDLNAMN